VRYNVQFANHRLAEAVAPPFEIIIPDGMGRAGQTSEFQRQVREHAVNLLKFAPAFGASSNESEIARQTQVAVDLDAQQGRVFYGTDTVGHMTFWPVP
jgi:hypothetical protein